MRKQFIKWVLFWTVLGFAVPLFVLVHMSASGHAITSTEFVLWPTSVVFMGAPEGRGATSGAMVKVYAVAIGLNAILYTLVGLLTSPLPISIRKLRHRVRSPEQI